MSTGDTDNPRAARAPAGHARPAPRTVESADLLRGAEAMHIRHGNALYTLRVTRQDKLILTK